LATRLRRLRRSPPLPVANINRGLDYGALTALLGLVYTGGVVAVGGVFRIVSHESNNLAVAASTLAVAALFRPVRTRMQGSIDRRF
jgi:hypothetical protein